MSNLPPSVSAAKTRPLAPPLTAEQLTTLKRAVLKKGAEVNMKLTSLLAGQRVNVYEQLAGGKPGETPIEKLQRFMALVDGTLKAMRDGRYGKCQTCSEWLSYDDLNGLLWLDTCRSCAAAAAAAAAAPPAVS